MSKIVVSQIHEIKAMDPFYPVMYILVENMLKGVGVVKNTSLTKSNDTKSTPPSSDG
jgi:hypothetical protein